MQAGIYFWGLSIFIMITIYSVLFVAIHAERLWWRTFFYIKDNKVTCEMHNCLGLRQWSFSSNTQIGIYIRKEMNTHPQ